MTTGGTYQDWIAVAMLFTPAGGKAKNTLQNNITDTPNSKKTDTDTSNNKKTDENPSVKKNTITFEAENKPQNGEAYAEGGDAPIPPLKRKRPPKPEQPVLDAEGNLTEYGKWYYERPSGFRKGVREKVYEAAKEEDGIVRDPYTKNQILYEDKWDMGHKPGSEFRKHQLDAAKRGISRKEFLNEHNKIERYRPETQNTNRSHILEEK